MAALIESMAYNSHDGEARYVPWHTLGTPLDGYTNSEQMLMASGLDYEVSFADVTVLGQILKDRFAVVKEDTQTILSILSDKYKIVQNREAFAFIDAIVGNGYARYETAGALDGWKRTWCLAKTEESMTVAGDKIDPYILFSNSFDGKSGVRVAITPVRVVCANTLAMALHSQRIWSADHTGNIQDQLMDAEKTLALTDEYLEEFPVAVEKMVDTVLYRDEVIQFIDSLFPIEEGVGKRGMNNNMRLKETLMQAYEQTPDLKKFMGTAWGMYNAVSDMVTHVEPLRRTRTYNENMFMKVADGHPIIDRAQMLLMKVKA